MIAAPLRTTRFLATWLTGRSTVLREELTGPDGEEGLPTTVFRPRGLGPETARWIVLHGITRPGRRHPSLVRFGRALASSGAVVAVPEIREWTELRLAPERTVPAVRAAADLLETIAGGENRRPGVVGFSFGAPQAVLASLDPDLRGRLAGVVGFGGYCDLERTVRFHFTGEHEWNGERRWLRPDPYGRWVIGANFLSRIPDHGDAEDVARALWRLAALAGERRIQSWDPSYDPAKREIRREVAPGRRDLFDLFAPPSGEEPDRDRVEALVPELARAGRNATPLIDPGPHLATPPCPVRLLHGRGDHLVPYTETMRLERCLPPEADVDATITGLFAHSGESPLKAGIEAVREGWSFVRALGGVLSLP